MKPAISPIVINQARARVTWWIRGAAVAMVVLGGLLILKQVFMGIMLRQPFMAFDVYEGIGRWG